MSTSERDTHFANFAKLLWEEMLSQTQWLGIDVTAGHIPLHHPEDEEHQQYIQIIARRAFDLAEHVIKHQHGSNLDEMKSEGLAHFLEVSYPDFDRLPDMTSFPD